MLRAARTVVIATGTPVDEYLNPKVDALLKLVNGLKPYLDPDQTIIIRSTVYPRTGTQVLKYLCGDGGDWHVAYCPERIAQGYAIKELESLPQLVAGPWRGGSGCRRPASPMPEAFTECLRSPAIWTC